MAIRTHCAGYCLRPFTANVRPTLFGDYCHYCLRMYINQRHLPPHQGICTNCKGTSLVLDGAGYICKACGHSELIILNQNLTYTHHCTYCQKGFTSGTAKAQHEVNCYKAPNNQNKSAFNQAWAVSGSKYQANDPYADLYDAAIAESSKYKSFEERCKEILKENKTFVPINEFEELLLVTVPLLGEEDFKELFNELKQEYSSFYQSRAGRFRFYSGRIPIPWNPLHYQIIFILEFSRRKAEAKRLVELEAKLREAERIESERNIAAQLKALQKAAEELGLNTSKHMTSDELDRLVQRTKLAMELEKEFPKLINRWSGAPKEKK